MKFTKEGLEKIKKELDNLKNVKRKEIAERIRHAASFGDLRENAAYDEAKDAQAFLEGKIMELSEKIRTAEVVESNADSDKVYIGSLIKVQSQEGTESFQVVVPEEVNVLEGKISCESPLGKAFMGKSKGEEVKIETPAGENIYKIIDIC